MKKERKRNNQTQATQAKGDMKEKMKEKKIKAFVEVMLKESKAKLLELESKSEEKIEKIESYNYEVGYIG